MYLRSKKLYQIINEKSGYIKPFKTFKDYVSEIYNSTFIMILGIIVNLNSPVVLKYLQKPKTNINLKENRFKFKWYKKYYKALP